MTVFSELPFWNFPLLYDNLEHQSLAIFPRSLILYYQVSVQISRPEANEYLENTR